MDRGVNGGVFGNDAIVILTHTWEVDVTGMDNHELNALKIVDTSAKVLTQLTEDPLYVGLPPSLQCSQGSICVSRSGR